jgi:hypothetical protein
MASIATAATRAEIVTLHKSVSILETMLRQVVDGSFPVPATPGRFTAAEIDTQITAVSNAITAATS